MVFFQAVHPVKLAFPHSQVDPVGLYARSLVHFPLERIPHSFPPLLRLPARQPQQVICDYVFPNRLDDVLHGREYEKHAAKPIPHRWLVDCLSVHGTSPTILFFRPLLNPEVASLCFDSEPTIHSDQSR